MLGHPLYEPPWENAISDVERNDLHSSLILSSWGEGFVLWLVSLPDRWRALRTRIIQTDLSVFEGTQINFTFRRMRCVFACIGWEIIHGYCHVVFHSLLRSLSVQENFQMPDIHFVRFSLLKQVSAPCRKFYFHSFYTKDEISAIVFDFMGGILS